MMPKYVRVALLFGLWVGGYLFAALLQGWRIPALAQLALVAGSFVGVLYLDAHLNDRYARRQFTRFPWVTGPHPPQHVRRKRTPPDR
jgi:hypothetical protein